MNINNEIKETIRIEMKKSVYNIDVISERLKAAEWYLRLCKCQLGEIDIALDKDEKENREDINCIIRKWNEKKEDIMVSLMYTKDATRLDDGRERLKKMIMEFYGIGNKNLEDLWDGEVK